MELFEEPRHGKVMRNQLSAFGLWLAVTGIAAYLHPDPNGHGTHTQLGFPPCPSAFLFHRPCPGCGLTTSFTALIHGQFGFAFHAHPLGPALYLLFTLWAWASFYAWCKRREFNTNVPWVQWSCAAFAILFFGFGLLRMAMVGNYTTWTDLRAAAKTTPFVKP